MTDKGDCLLELVRDDENRTYRLFIYDPKKNTVDEAGKGLVIPFGIDIYNAIWNCKDIYFAALSGEGSRKKIDLYMYSAKTKTEEIIYSFTIDEKLDLYNVRIKIFIFTGSVIIVQLETTDNESSDELMGHISFSQYLVDLENEIETKIVEENIVNNGINIIRPVSPTHIMIKTGYSFIEDYRYDVQSESEALIETVFINSSSRFLADLQLKSKTIDMQLLASAYYDKYILSPDFKGDYIYFTIVDPSNDTSETIYYNIHTQESLNCKNEQIDPRDLNVGYVIGGVPYVKNTVSSDIKFLNLTTMEFDLSCMGDLFIGIIGDLLILGKVNNKGAYITQIFSYPKMELVCEHKGRMSIGCAKDDDYYLYFV